MIHVHSVFIAEIATLTLINKNKLQQHLTTLHSTSFHSYFNKTSVSIGPSPLAAKEWNHKFKEEKEKERMFFFLISSGIYHFSIAIPALPCHVTW